MAQDQHYGLVVARGFLYNGERIESGTELPDTFERDEPRLAGLLLNSGVIRRDVIVDAVSVADSINSSEQPGPSMIAAAAAALAPATQPATKAKPKRTPAKRPARQSAAKSTAKQAQEKETPDGGDKPDPGSAADLESEPGNPGEPG